MHFSTLEASKQVVMKVLGVSEKKIDMVKVPLRRKFVGLFRPKSVAEYRVVSIFTQKTEQEIVHPNIF